MPDPFAQYELELQRHVAALNKRILKIYEKSIQDIRVTLNTLTYKGTLFNVNDYPALKKKIESATRSMQTRIYATSVNGIKESWGMSNKKNDTLVDERLAGIRLKKGLKQVLYNPNKKGLDAFISRKEKGMNLSDRVWNLLDPFKKELEQTIGLGLGTGRSAADIARDAKKYLREPNKLFRRVEGEDGKLHLSKAAREYHPGQGVYRSSYQNALRLTRTENNIAYRTADWERWQNLEFVIGIEIKLSKNHPRYDICDPLAGEYPKDFKFTGWHPNCLCYQVPMMMDDEEFEELEDQILAGEPVGIDSKAKIENPPVEFDKYLEENKERIAGWKNKPYFMRDNPGYVQAAGTDPVNRLMVKARIEGPWVQETAVRVAAKYGATVTDINYKTRGSIIRKARDEYNGVVEDVKDAVRNTIIAKTNNAIDKILNEFDKNVIGTSRIKKQLASGDPLGYSGNVINLTTKSGIHAEIQVNTPEMIYAKDIKESAMRILGEKKWNEINKRTGLPGGLGHKYYEEWRLLKLTDPKSLKRKAELEKLSTEYYSHFR